MDAQADLSLLGAQVILLFFSWFDSYILLAFPIQTTVMPLIIMIIGT